MVEDRRNPRRICVAIVALIAARDMRRRLASRLNAVVATRTTPGHRRVIHISDDQPACSYMAVRTFARRHDMRGGFRRGSHQAVGGVTTGACRARRCERSTDMAALTRDIQMRAIEHKSRAEMIERLLSVDSVRGKQQANCQNYGKQTVHRSDLTSINDFTVWQRLQSVPNSPS